MRALLRALLDVIDISTALLRALLDIIDISTACTLLYSPLARFSSGYASATASSSRRLHALMLRASFPACNARFLSCIPCCPFLTCFTLVKRMPVSKASKACMHNPGGW
jgi:hypothetical protein